MKKNYLLLLGLAVIYISCENVELPVGEENSLESVTETTETDVETVETELEIEDFEKIQSEFFTEIDSLNLRETENLDLESLESIDFQDLDENSDEEVATNGKSKQRKRRRRITSICRIKNADRCPFEDRQPASNMWWAEDETDYFNPTTYFSSRCMLFATFNDGSALIRGRTFMNDGRCRIFVNVWLKDKQTFDEFSANGGEFKLEPGCASQAANEEELMYYEIDKTRSWLYVRGADCIEEGCFGLEQRGENLRGQLGPNGAAFDSNIGALGFSNWGWITKHGERLWVMDFDFRLICCREKW